MRRLVARSALNDQFMLDLNTLHELLSAEAERNLSLRRATSSNVRPFPSCAKKENGTSARLLPLSSLGCQAVFVKLCVLYGNRSNEDPLTPPPAPRRARL